MPVTKPSGQGAAQNPAQYRAESQRTDKKTSEAEKQNTPEIPGYSARYVPVRDEGMTPTGCELSSNSSGKTQNSKRDGAFPGAPDPDLALIVARWPDLSADVRKMIAGVVRLTPKADASNAQGPRERGK
jgi:hypothetical protein